MLKEGDKVKLNYEKITSHKDYYIKTEKYKKWIEENKDRIFTIKYDEGHKNNPLMVELKEDNSCPKWLFWEGYLIKI